MDGAVTASPAPPRITRSNVRRLPTMDAKSSQSTAKVSHSASNTSSNKTSSAMPPPSTMPPPRTPVPRLKIPVAAPRATKKLATEKDVLSTPSGISRAGQSVQLQRSTPLQSSVGSSRGNVAVPATPHQAPSRMPSDNNLARKTISTETKGDNTRAMATPAGQSQRSLRPPTTMTRVSRINKSNLKTPHSFSGSTSQIRSKVPSKSGVENIVPESDESAGYIAEVHSEPPNSHSVVPGPSAVKKFKQPSLDEGSSHSHDASPLTPPEPSIDVAAIQSEVLSLRDQLDTERKISAQITSQTQGLHQELSSLRNEVSIKDALLETSSAENRLLNSQIAELEESLREALQLKEEELCQREQQHTEAQQAHLATIQTLEASIQALQKSLEDKDSELETLQKNFRETKEKGDKFEQQLRSLTAKHEAEMGEVVTEKALLLKKADDAQKEAGSWQTALELKTVELRKVQTELAQVQLENERLTAVERENANVKMKNEDLTVRNEALATTEKKLRSTVKENEEKIEVLSRRSTMLCQEKETLIFKMSTPGIATEKEVLLEEEEVEDQDTSGSL